MTHGCTGTEAEGIVALATLRAELSEAETAHEQLEAQMYAAAQRAAERQGGLEGRCMELMEALMTIAGQRDEAERLLMEEQDDDEEGNDAPPPSVGEAALSGSEPLDAPPPALAVSDGCAPPAADVPSRPLSVAPLLAAPNDEVLAPAATVAPGVDRPQACAASASIPDYGNAGGGNASGDSGADGGSSALPMDDATIIARLDSLGADWSAAPSKLRSLLLGAAVQGVSEKRLRALKALRALLAESASSAAEETSRALKAPSARPADGDATEVASWGEGIEVRAGRGRCAVATADLVPGGEVRAFSGAPYASCLLPGLMTTRCDTCYEAAAERLVPCTGCNVVHYCSPACRLANAAQHRRECAPLSRRRSRLDALRTECEAGSIGRFGGLLLAVRCLWRRHDGAPRTMSSSAARGESGGGSPRRHSASAADGDKADAQTEIATTDADAAAFEDRLFDTLAPGATSDDDTLLGELASASKGLLPPGVDAAAVAKLLGNLRVNMIAIASDAHVQHAPTLADTSTIIGVGHYPRTAILNHSCVPNCVLAYEGGAGLRVRCAAHVHAGEELCHSYTDLCAPTRLRRLALRNKYGFECDCARCRGVVTADGEDVDFVMEAVAGPPPDEAGGAAGVDGTAEGGGGVADDVDSWMRASEVQLARAEKAEDPAKAMKLTRMALATRRQYCHPYAMLRYHAESACCELAVQQRNPQLARECCRNVLAFYEAALRHVPWHPSLSLERYQLAELEARCGARDTAARLLNVAYSALVVTHGEQHGLTRRVVGRRDELLVELRSLALEKKKKKQEADAEALNMRTEKPGGAQKDARYEPVD